MQTKNSFIIGPATRALSLYEQAASPQPTVHDHAADFKLQLAAFGFVMNLLAKIGVLVLEIPCTRLFERTVCRKYYRISPTTPSMLRTLDEIDEHLCKLPSIQRKVVVLVGWREFSLAIPGCPLTCSRMRLMLTNVRIDECRLLWLLRGQTW